jgi:hypothetical protein
MDLVPWNVDLIPVLMISFHGTSSIYLVPETQTDPYTLGKTGSVCIYGLRPG